MIFKNSSLLLWLFLILDKSFAFCFLWHSYHILIRYWSGFGLLPVLSACPKQDAYRRCLDSLKESYYRKRWNECKSSEASCFVVQAVLRRFKGVFRLLAVSLLSWYETAKNCGRLLWLFVPDFFTGGCQIFCTVYRCESILPLLQSRRWVIIIYPQFSRFFRAISTVGNDIQQFSDMFFLEGKHWYFWSAQRLR